MSRRANELWTFMELDAGDKVIANRGTLEVLAIGTVNDDGYGWRPERDKYRHTLGVDWHTSFARKIEPVRRGPPPSPRSPLRCSRRSAPKAAAVSMSASIGG